MILPVIGPRRHGVVEFGVDLAKVLQYKGSRTASTQGIHLQFTDAIFGPTPAAAATAVRVVVADAAARGLRVTATLHDVPQPSDGEYFAARVDAYAAVCEALYAVVVSSDHERMLLVESGIRPQRIATVHLPIHAGVHPPAVPTAAPSVGVFGFVYPGKGHLEVMDALRDVDPGVGMVAVGEPSAGHEWLLDELRATARRQGRTFTVTGHVPDARLHDALREVTVPVAHHRHVSASGSLNTWLAAGRRPLAPVNRYTTEMSALNPGAFQLYPDDGAGLRGAIGRALADPDMTWLPPGTTVTPTPAEAAAQYEELFRCWHR